MSESSADFLSLLHVLHYLKDDGVMAIILPQGVLFRDGRAATKRHNEFLRELSLPELPAFDTKLSNK